MSTASAAPAAARTAPDAARAGDGDGRRRLGTLSIAFMIIAASAPLTTLAGGVPTSFAVSESLGVPAGYLLLAAILLLFAVGYAAMSRFITNAGAFYAYVAQGLSRSLGIGASLSALVAYNAMQIGIAAMFGFSISDYLSTRFGIDTPWWLWVLVGIVVVGIMGVLRVDLSAKVLAVLVAGEFLIVIITDILGFMAAPEGVSAEGLSPGALFAPGLGAVLAFGVAAFMGFEQAAIYVEEAKEPEKTIPRATYIAVIVAGLFYAFSSWALEVGVGPSQIIPQSQDLGPGIVFAFLGERAGELITDLAQVLFITSLFAAMLAFHNAVARYFFSLGREGVLPRWLGSVRGEHRAPWAGSVTQSIIALLVLAGFAIAGAGSDDPLYPVLTMFTWLVNTGAFGLVMLMAIVAAAVVGFFLKDHRGVGVFQRLIAPGISVLTLGAVFVLILMNWDMLLGQTESNALTFLLPALVIVPGIIGALWGMMLRSSKPELYERIGHNMVEAPELEVFDDPAIHHH